MSMVPEVLVARHAGMRVLAVTVVSDACIPEALKPASVEELLRVAAETEPALTTLLIGVLSRLGSSASSPRSRSNTEQAIARRRRPRRVARSIAG